MKTTAPRATPRFHDGPGPRRPRCDGWYGGRLERWSTAAWTIEDGGSAASLAYARRRTRWPPPVSIRDPRFYRRLVFGGSLGAAEAYIRGYWTCDDLVDLVRIFCRNAALAAGLERGPAADVSARWPRLATGCGATRRREAVATSPPTTIWATTSSRCSSMRPWPIPARSFHRPSSTLLRGVGGQVRPHLPEARADGRATICSRSASGWGGFALHAARHYGCRVTTTTISREQYEFARKRVGGGRPGGPRDGADARTTASSAVRYDKLVSIEMIEAVGHQYFDTYFRVCSRAAEARRHDAACRRSSSPISGSTATGGRWTSSSATSSPAAASRPSAPSARSLGRATDFGSSTWRTSRRTTPRPWRTGGSGSGQPRPGPEPGILRGIHPHLGVLLLLLRRRLPRTGDRRRADAADQARQPQGGRPRPQHRPVTRVHSMRDPAGEPGQHTLVVRWY